MHPDSAVHLQLRTFRFPIKHKVKGRQTYPEIIINPLAPFFQTGRKLMPRSRPFCKKVSKVSSVDTNAFEDEIYAYLYVSDDVE